MQRQRTKRKAGYISTGALIIALALVWFAVAPLPLLGQNSYLITSGTSMLPDIERGDLVVTRKSYDYRVGDVVAYQDPTIGAVLHRIIAEEGDRFVLQGDNNDFIDPYRPARSEVLGKKVLHLPDVGAWLANAYEPRNAALLAVAGGLVLAAPVGTQQAQQARRRHGRGGGGSSAPPPASPSPGRFAPGPAGQIVGLMAGCLALAAILLASLSYSMPLERRTAVPVSYAHQGEFSYTSDMAGTVYPDGMATSGEPVYRQLAETIDVRFDYALESAGVVAGGGTYRMDAVIRQDDGWSRTLTIVDETAFEGGAARIDGVLDIAAVQAEIDSAREQTGLDSQPLRSYDLDLTVRIDPQATVAGVPLEGSFSPSLHFVVEPLVVSVAATSSEGDGDPFRQSTSGMVDEYRYLPNSLSLPGYALEVGRARAVAQLGMTVAVAGGLLLLAMVGITSGRDEPARIQARYGALLVSLRGVDLGDDGRLIEVGSMADLAKVAEREGRMILHRESGSIHQYFVQDVDVTYRYQVRIAPAAGRAPGVERAL